MMGDRRGRGRKIAPSRAWPRKAIAKTRCGTENQPQVQRAFWINITGGHEPELVEWDEAANRIRERSTQTRIIIVGLPRRH